MSQFLKSFLNQVAKKNSKVAPDKEYPLFIHMCGTSYSRILPKYFVMSLSRNKIFQNVTHLL